MTRLIALTAAVVVTAGSPAVGQTLPAEATFAYAWYQGAMNVTGDTLSPTFGGTVALDLYLFETSATTVLSGEGGLFGGGARATYDSGVVTLGGVSDVTYNPQFNDTASSDASRQADNPGGFGQFAGVSDGSQAATVGSGPAVTTGIYLGSFTYSVATSPSPASTTVTAIPTVGLTSLVTFTNGFELDAVTSSASVTITPVPEPGLMLGVAAVGLGAVRAVRRRRVG